MKEKINQKGFIQIPILIGIIVAIVLVSGVATGIVLHKQEKLAPLIASVSQIFKGAEETIKEKELKKEKSIIEEPQIEQQSKETSQQEQELEQAKLEAGKAKKEAEEAKAEAERLRKEAEEKQKEIAKQQELEKQKQLKEQRQKNKQQSEIYRKNILAITNLIREEAFILQELQEKGLKAAESRRDSLNDIIRRNKLLFIDNSYSSEEIRNIAEIFEEAFNIDLKMTTYFRDTFKKGIEIGKGVIQDYNRYYNDLLIYKGMITKEEYEEKMRHFIKEHSSLGETQKTVLKVINGYLNWVEDMEQDYEDALALIKMRYSSSYYQIPQTYRIELYESPSLYESIMNDYYKQEQIRALNRISQELNNIWSELRY